MSTDLISDQLVWTNYRIIIDEKTLNRTCAAVSGMIE